MQKTNLLHPFLRNWISIITHLSVRGINLYKTTNYLTHALWDSNFDYTKKLNIPICNLNTIS